jgi:CRP-like cAMP-binding protein
MLRTRPHRTARSRLDSLRQIPTLAELPDATLAHLDSQMAEVELPAGATLVTEHARGREAFIIADGLAEVSVDGRPITSVTVGDLVGEMSLLDNGPRTATVTALTPVRIYVLDARQFAVLFEHPVTARWIATALARRIRELDERSRVASAAGLAH